MFPRQRKEIFTEDLFFFCGVPKHRSEGFVLKFKNSIDRWPLKEDNTAPFVAFKVKLRIRSKQRLTTRKIVFSLLQNCRPFTLCEYSIGCLFKNEICFLFNLVDHGKWRLTFYIS